MSDWDSIESYLVVYCRTDDLTMIGSATSTGSLPELVQVIPARRRAGRRPGRAASDYGRSNKGPG